MYCGTDVPETLTLNATVVTLIFTSDYAETDRGFKMEFKVQSAPSTGMITTGAAPPENIEAAAELTTANGGTFTSSSARLGS